MKCNPFSPAPKDWDFQDAESVRNDTLETESIQY